MSVQGKGVTFLQAHFCPHKFPTLALFFLFLFHGKQAYRAGLKAQTIPNATPETLKNHSFSKITITFEPIMQF